MFWRRHRTISLLAAMGLMLACLPTLGPASAPIPTFDANAPLTAIVLTAGAAATQTAANQPPTATLIPNTNTPLPTLTATPTFLFALPTPSLPPTQIPLGVSGRKYECQVLKTEPGFAIPVSQAFIGKWLIANIGTSEWDGNNADYHYLEGDKFHLQSAYDFSVSVAPGVTVELPVDMQAPSTPGTYTSHWRIRIGKNDFCPLEITITVV
ncbi:MAG: hypothetical protein IPP55_06265 [Anaerolineales bacterium]|nr:hypothetical protein [Anaerolineales bacterium]